MTASVPRRAERLPGQVRESEEPSDRPRHRRQPWKWVRPAGGLAGWKMSAPGRQRPYACPVPAQPGTRPPLPTVAAGCPPLRWAN